MQNSTLRGIPKELLEDHVLDRIKHFAVVFAQELVPGITQQQLDLAFSRTLYSLSAQETNGGQAQLELRFTHSCRFLGCQSQDCALCKNNPHKTCGAADNFDEAYADNQVLKATCEAEIYVELVNQVTGEVFSAPGVEVQLSVIDGDAYNEAAPEPLATIMELHTSDEGVPLLQCYGSNRAIHVGTVVASLQNGRAKLPDVFITDKNDTFHFNDGATTGHFRLLALAMRRDELGHPVPVEGVAPAVSNSFVVKTQRALNDYRKSAYPHYKDELTRLRYIGAITANRLKDARTWVGRDVPVECVDSVQTLKQLLEYADTNRAVEQKLLELLNMRGRHRHKWDFLRHVLAEKVVYDDNHFRVWYAPEANGCGLLYAAKQAQIQNMDKPAGVAQRVQRPDGTAVVQVMMLSDIHQNPPLLEWRRQAEASWRTPGHPGWQVLQEEIDYVTNWPATALRAKSQGMLASPPPAQQQQQQQQLPPAAAAAIGVMGSTAPLTAAVDMGLQQGMPGPASAAVAQQQNPKYSNMAQQQLQQQQQLAQQQLQQQQQLAQQQLQPQLAQQQQVQQQLAQQQQAQQQTPGGADVFSNIGMTMQNINGLGQGLHNQQQQMNAASLRVHSEPMQQHLNSAAAAAAALRSHSDAFGMAMHHAAEALGLRSQSDAQAQTMTHALHTQQQAQQQAAAAAAAALQQRQQQAQQQLAADRHHSIATVDASNPHPCAPIDEETEAAGSAFMVQHPFDAVEVALARDVHHAQELMGLGGGASGAGRGGTVKRGRAAGEVHAVADPHTNSVLYTTASRDRHKPQARVAGDVGQGPRQLTDFVSLTPEEVEALTWAHSDRQDTLEERDDARIDDDDAGNGMTLTSTFSAALRIGDSLDAPLLSALNKGGGRGLGKTTSDSFRRLMGEIGSGELPLEAMLDGLGSGDSAGAAGDGSNEQHKNRLVDAS